MNGYREWIQKRKNDELLKTIGTLLAVGGAATLGTYGIYSLGKEAGKRENK